MVENELVGENETDEITENDTKYEVFDDDETIEKTGDENEDARDNEVVDED